MELQFLFTKATSHNWPCACACVKVFITVWSWQLLAKKKPHTKEWLILPMVPAHSMCQGCLGILPCWLMEMAVLAKEQVPLHQRGEGFLDCALPRPSSDIFFLFPFWVCCQSGLSYTPTKCSFKRDNWTHGAIQSVATNVEFVGTFLHMSSYMMEGVVGSAWAMLLKQQVAR